MSATKEWKVRFDRQTGIESVEEIESEIIHEIPINIYKGKYELLNPKSICSITYMKSIWLILCLFTLRHFINRQTKGALKRVSFGKSVKTLFQHFVKKGSRVKKWFLHLLHYCKLKVKLQSKDNGGNLDVTPSQLSDCVRSFNQRHISLFTTIIIIIKRKQDVLTYLCFCKFESLSEFGSFRPRQISLMSKSSFQFVNL